MIRFDRNMNFAPDKQHSRKKIDGIVAAIISGAVALSDVGEETVQKGIYGNLKT